MAVRVFHVLQHLPAERTFAQRLEPLIQFREIVVVPESRETSTITASCLNRFRLPPRMASLKLRFSRITEGIHHALPPQERSPQQPASNPCRKRHTQTRGADEGLGAAGNQWSLSHPCWHCTSSTGLGNSPDHLDRLPCGERCDPPPERVPREVCHTVHTGPRHASGLRSGCCREHTQ